MSKFRELAESCLLNNEENPIEEGTFSKILGTLATAATIGLGGTNALAKTDHEALHNNHEITAKYEHGGKGYNAITKDNYGGYSYGKWQISTERRDGKPSTFDFFLRYAKDHNPGIYTNLQRAGGQPGAYKGTTEFINKWKKLAQRKDFRDLYDGFILNTQVVPVYDRMDNSGINNLDKVTTWGSHDNAIQAAIKSAIVQHGPNGAYNMIKKVMERENCTNKAEFLKELYDYRKEKFPKYKNRYENEYKDLKKYLKSGESELETIYGKKPGESGYELDQLINKLSNQ